MSPSTPPTPPTALTGRLQAGSMQDSFAQPRAHRHRCRMFVVVMLLACVTSLTMQAAEEQVEHQTVARWQWVYPAAAEPAGSRSHDSDAAFLTEVMVVTRRPVLEKLHEEMQ